jgi:hypothetical protein
MAGRPSANAAHEKRLHLPPLHGETRRRRIKCAITCWRMAPSCWLVSSATVLAIARINPTPAGQHPRGSNCRCVQ